MILYGQTAAVSAWVAAQLPVLGAGADFGPAQAMGVVRDGDLVAGVVVHGYMPDLGSAEFTMAATSPKWASRRGVAEMLRYPFGQLGVWRLWAATAVSNERSRRFARGMGFHEEGPLRDYYGPGLPAVILSMTAAEFAARYEGLI